MFVGGKGSSQPDQADDDSGDQEDNQNDQSRGNVQQNGYSRGGRGRGRGFRGYRPRYIRRGGFRSQKPIANQGVSWQIHIFNEASRAVLFLLLYGELY